MPIFALYNFDDTGLIAADSALSNGAQDGAYFDGAAPSGGRAILDGINDKVKIYPNSEFQLARGTLEILVLAIRSGRSTRHRFVA